MNHSVNNNYRVTENLFTASHVLICTFSKKSTYVRMQEVRFSRTFSLRDEWEGVQCVVVKSERQQ